MSPLVPRHRRSLVQQTIHYWVRPHEHVPETPIRCSAAWRGDELTANGGFIHTLSPREVDELDAAAAHAKRTGRPLAALTREDFPLPTLSSSVVRWREALRDGVGVQVVRGFPVMRWDQPTSELVTWCMGLHLGIPGAQNGDGDLLGHVRDTGASYDDPAVRGYKTAAHLSYHCDAADVVGLMCLRAAKHGGQSRFVSSVTVFNELLARRPDLAPRLFEPFELDTRGDGGVDFVPIAPCRFAEGHLRTFYHADYYRTAEQHRGATPLGARERELLDLYDEIASTPGIYLDMDFAPGDFQLLSNHTVLHSRTAYEDGDTPDEKRHLLRLWLSLDGPFASFRGVREAKETARLLGALLRGRVRKRLARRG